MLDLKDWITSMVGAQFHTIFQRKAWILEWIGEAQIFLWQNDTDDKWREIANKKKKEDTEKSSSRSETKGKSQDKRERDGSYEEEPERRTIRQFQDL